MFEKNALRMTSILILCVGIYVCARPADVAEKIKTFYSNYPVIRDAGAEQLTSRSIFVRILGVVIIILGLLCFFSL